MTKGYDDFKTKCELVSEMYKVIGLSHMIECRDYEEHHWFCCHFMIDKFGGGACTIKFYNDQWIYEEGTERKIMKSLADALVLVPHAIEETHKSRNLQEICDLINAEYD